MVVAEAGLVLVAQDWLMVVAQAGLVVVTQAGLIVVTQAGLIIVAQAGLVAVAQDWLMVVAQAGLIVLAQAWLMVLAQPGLMVVSPRKVVVSRFSIDFFICKTCIEIDVTLGDVCTAVCFKTDDNVETVAYCYASGDVEMTFIAVHDAVLATILGTFWNNDKLTISFFFFFFLKGWAFKKLSNEKELMYKLMKYQELFPW